MPSFTQSRKGTSNASTRSFMNSLLSKLPYTYRLLDDMRELNPKYEKFNQLTTRKDDRIAIQSVTQVTDPNNITGNAGIMINKDYHNYMYANVDADKVRRIQQYRRMAAYAEVSDAIDEIVDETIVKDRDGDIIKFRLEGISSEDIKKEVKKEWQGFVEIFGLEDKGWEYFRQFLIDGEIFFENVISENRPEYGILGVVIIPAELMNPVYDNVQNGIIKGFILRKQTEMQKQNDRGNESLVMFDRNQITYVNSGMWNEDRSIRIPYIENCRRAYKQLSLIEDSIVIYRLVRAPERLVFYVDVGNMPAPKAEQYLQKLMKQYWSRKSYDSTGKSVNNVYDPQSMLDSFWFAKKTGSEGTKVDILQGGQNLGQLDDLMYFVRKLYKSLKVPIGRLNPEDAFKDALDMTREELRFAKFIMRLQRQFAIGIRDSFIVHLKLRKLWDKYKLKEQDINLLFNTPTHFMIIRDNQAFNLKFENFNNMSNSELVANSFAQRYYLEWNDDMMSENREWLRKDNELMWELEQIRVNGPDFREKQNELEAAVGDIQGGGGVGAPAGGGLTGPAVGSAKAEVGGFKPEVPPEFGPGPAPAGGAPGGAPAGGQPGAPA